MLKKNSVLLWLAVVSLTACNTAEKKAETVETTDLVATNDGKAYVVEKNNQIKWLGQKLTGKHFGTVAISKGLLFADSNQLTGGSFTLDMNKIEVLDLTDPGKKADLTDHLKSEDFFSAVLFPEAVFEITGVESLAGPDEAGNNTLVSGDLTIKGIKQGIRFPATVTFETNKILARAAFEIDRTLWDIKYRSGKFFPELGDKVISDQIGISFELYAAQK